jgi:signal peptidase I
VSEIQPISEPITAESAPSDLLESTPNPQPRRRRLIAIILSTLVPGLGQLALGQRWQSYLFFVLTATIGALYWFARLPQSYRGWVFLLFAAIALWMIAASHAAVSRHPGCHHVSSWWLILVLPVAFLSGIVFSNLGLVSSGFHIYGIPSTSMEPTIARGDHIVADLRYFRRHPISKGDIVLFKHEGTVFVKRVMALGGSTIWGEDTVVHVDDETLNEPYVSHNGYPQEQLDNFGPITVPAGKLFVMGDNREVSLDSRTSEYGPIDAVTVIGKPLYIFRSDADRTGRSFH